MGSLAYFASTSRKRGLLPAHNPHKPRTVGSETVNFLLAMLRTSKNEMITTASEMAPKKSIRHNFVLVFAFIVSTGADVESKLFGSLQATRRSANSAKGA
jgi:hypothetical protein